MQFPVYYQAQPLYSPYETVYNPHGLEYYSNQQNQNGITPKKQQIVRRSTLKDEVDEEQLFIISCCGTVTTKMIQVICYVYAGSLQWFSLSITIMDAQASAAIYLRGIKGTDRCFALLDSAFHKENSTEFIGVLKNDVPTLLHHVSNVKLKICREIVGIMNSSSIESFSQKVCSFGFWGSYGGRAKDLVCSISRDITEMVRVIEMLICFAFFANLNSMVMTMLLLKIKAPYLQRGLHILDVFIIMFNIFIVVYGFIAISVRNESIDFFYGFINIYVENPVMHRSFYCVLFSLTWSIITAFFSAHMYKSILALKMRDARRLKISQRSGECGQY